MTWTVPDPSAVDGPLVGADRPMLEAYLRWQRRTFLNICAGLTPEQLARRPIATTRLTLLGLIRHLAKVERIWLRQRAAGESVEPLYARPGESHDFGRIDPADAEAAVQRLEREWELADRAARDLPFDTEVRHHDETMSLRMVYLHLIGEYARHNGHADLLREAIDGVTGR